MDGRQELPEAWHSWTWAPATAKMARAIWKLSTSFVLGGITNPKFCYSGGSTGRSRVTRIHFSKMGCHSVWQWLPTSKTCSSPNSWLPVVHLNQQDTSRPRPFSHMVSSLGSAYLRERMQLVVPTRQSSPQPEMAVDSRQIRIGGSMPGGKPDGTEGRSFLMAEGCYTDFG